MARKKEPTFITEQKPFPQRLRLLMDERGVTQIELANFVGCARQSMSQYATGQSLPDINILLKISEFFEVSADYLLGKTEEKTVDPDIKKVCKYTGLSEAAVKNTRDIKCLCASDKYITNSHLGDIPLFIINYILSQEFLYEYLNALTDKYQRVALQKLLSKHNLIFLDDDKIQRKYDKESFLEDCGAFYDKLAEVCLTKFEKNFNNSFGWFLKDYQLEAEEKLDKIQVLKEELKKELKSSV